MHKLIVHVTELCIGSILDGGREVCRLTYFPMHKCTIPVIQTKQCSPQNPSNPAPHSESASNRRKNIHMPGQARTQWSTHGARAAARTVPQAAYRCCQQLSSSGDSWANPHACGSCANSIASKMHWNCQIVDLRTKAKRTRASSGRAKRAGRIRDWTSHYRNDCRGNLVSH